MQLSFGMTTRRASYESFENMPGSAKAQTSYCDAETKLQATIELYKLECKRKASDSLVKWVSDVG